MKNRNKLLIMFSVIIMLLTLSLSASAALVGDVTGDGDGITAGDARMILRASVGLEELSEEAFLIADTNLDGKISALDARTVLRMSVNLEETAHFYSREVITAPDCTNQGKGLATCTECEDVFEYEVPAMGHDFGEPEIVTEVTCETDGTEKYTCQREGCGYTEEKTIPAGHIWDKNEVTCTEGRYCSRGDHTEEKLGHTTDWGVCTRCNIYNTEKYKTEAEIIKTKFNEAKTAFDYAYSINNYNIMLLYPSWYVLPNSREARPYYETAKTACEEAIAACGDIPEFNEIKALLEKNVTNLTVSIEEVDKIIKACNGNPGVINAVNYDSFVNKLETYNAGSWDSDYKDHTMGNNKKLVKAIVW